MYLLEVYVIVEPHGLAESAVSAPEQIWKWVARLIVWPG
jgi:hypothetical protein